MRLVFALFPLAFAVAAPACTTSGTLTSTGDGGISPDGSAVQGTCAGDAGSVEILPTAACAGDATRCLSGTFSATGFTAKYADAKVELYKVFPNGAVSCAFAVAVASDGTFAFSGLDPWAHYYLKGVARYGASSTTGSVSTLQGRFAIPSASATPIALVVMPAQLELLESTSVAAPRTLQYVSAHVFDPATGAELDDATVSVSSASFATTPMPFMKNTTGTSSYFASFATPPAAVGSVRVLVTGSSFGANQLTYTLTTEASLFDAPAITTPATGATIAAGQPLPVTWPAFDGADFTVVTLFLQSGQSFTGEYQSPSSNAPDVTSETVPGSAVPIAGKYLLNVNFAQTGCGLGGSQGCTTLLHAAASSLTAQ